jgi:hypothetical protein
LRDGRVRPALPPIGASEFGFAFGGNLSNSQLGLAYAMMTLCQQVGVAAVPLVIGAQNAPASTAR